MNKKNYNFKFVTISGDNVDCWMEIQHGKGPWAPPVSGIVPLGSTLTLVVAINDYRGKNESSTQIYSFSTNQPTHQSTDQCKMKFWIFFC